MSIYGFATKVATPTPIANDAILPDFTVYCRKTETGATQLNNKVNPQIVDEEWVDIPNRVYVNLTSTESAQTVGKLAALYAHEANHVEAWVKRYDETREDAIRAIRRIGNRLIEEAEGRSWCSEFDQIIDDVNSDLPGWLQLPEREREYEVRWTESYTITVPRSITVTAKSEEEACDIAADWEEADEYEMREAISAGNYSYDCDNGDYEAEEA